MSEYYAVQLGGSIYTKAPYDWGVARSSDHEMLADGLRQEDAEHTAFRWNRQPYLAADKSQCHDKAGLLKGARG